MAITAWYVPRTRRSRMSRYTGRSIATGGIIRMIRKTLANDRNPAEGDRAIAYAAGTPKAMDRAVDPSAITVELRRNSSTSKSRNVAA